MNNFKLNSLTNNKELRLFIIKWLLFWGGVMGGYMFILKPNGITYLENTHITLLYFFSLTTVGFFYFETKEKLRHFSNLKEQLRDISLVSILFLILTLFSDYFFPISEEVFSKLRGSEFFYPLFKLNTTVSKIVDIAFQQIFIWTLVLRLKQDLKNTDEVIKSFILIFFVLHIPLFIHFGLFSLVFTIPSIFAGGIFSYLILNTKKGLVYSVAIHQGFYLVLGHILRFTN